MTVSKLEAILSRRLKLSDPRFVLEKVGAKISGSLIDDKFSEMDDLQRQKAIWSALDKELGSESSTLVGTILAYTRNEWDTPLEGSPKNRPVRRVNTHRKSRTRISL